MNKNVEPFWTLVGDLKRTTITLTSRDITTVEEVDLLIASLKAIRPFLKSEVKDGTLTKKSRYRVRVGRKLIDVISQLERHGDPDQRVLDMIHIMAEINSDLKRGRDIWRAKARLIAYALELTHEEHRCSGHAACDGDPKICRRCGTHIDSMRPDDDE